VFWAHSATFAENSVESAYWTTVIAPNVAKRRHTCHHSELRATRVAANAVSLEQIHEHVEGVVVDVELLLRADLAMDPGLLVRAVDLRAEALAGVAVVRLVLLLGGEEEHRDVAKQARLEVAVDRGDALARDRVLGAHEELVELADAVLHAEEAHRVQVLVVGAHLVAVEAVRERARHDVAVAARVAVRAPEVDEPRDRPVELLARFARVRVVKVKALEEQQLRLALVAVALQLVLGEGRGGRSGVEQEDGVRNESESESHCGAKLGVVVVVSSWVVLRLLEDVEKMDFWSGTKRVRPFKKGELILQARNRYPVQFSSVSGY